MERLLITILLIGCVYSSVTASPAFAVKLVNAVKYVDSIVSIVNGIEKFFNGDNSGNDFKSMLTNAVNDIKEHINSAKTEVLNQILFNRKFDRIEDAVATIHALMIDLQHLVESSSTTVYRENVKTFITRFDESNIIQHIYWLPELLTYTAPGETHNLLELYTKDSRCSATALDELKVFYFNLLSNGISLQFVFRTLKGSTLEQRRQFWTETLQHLEKKFQLQNDECEKQLPFLALEDLKNSQTAPDLFKENKERYRKQSDVMFFSTKGTHQFTHIEDLSDDFLLQNDRNTFKISIFYETELKSTWNSNTLSRNLSAQIPTLRNMITSDGVHTASEIAASAKRIISESSPNVKTGSVVVFFKDQFEEPKILFSQDSPVVSVVITDVQLEYCHKSGFECTFSFILDSVKNANGEFHVYIYPEDPLSQAEAHVSGTDRISTNLPPVLLFMGSLLLKEIV